MMTDAPCTFSASGCNFPRQYPSGLRSAGLYPAISRGSSGWSLVELLATTAIVILLASMAVPTLSDWFQRSAATSTFNLINHAATFARVRAIREHQYFTVCGSSDSSACHAQWENRIIVFSDHNHNEIIDGPDRLYREFTLQKPAPCIQWRASAGRSYLQFKPNGGTNGTAGHFRLCDSHPDQSHKKLVVSLNGRTSMRTL